MKRKHQRLLFLGCSLALGIAAVLLGLSALKENIVYFYTPSELIASGDTGYARLGGLVEMGSVKAAGEEVGFRVTDHVREIEVVHRGLLPGLFREGQGVIAEGRLQPDGRFRAEKILAKHDEYYMPPEVAKALKASGRWKEQYRLK